MAVHPSEITSNSSSKSAYRMFEQQAQEHPDRIALEHRDGAWTYGQLNERANKVARFLASQGIGLESRVAIAMPRSPQRIMIQLGVLKAGGAYVPVDTGFPPARVDHMLSVARAELVITTRESEEDFEAFSFPSYEVDALEELCASLPAENLEIDVPEESVFTILFTSGSTGRPKGVLMLHSTLTNLLEWKQKMFPFQQDDAVLYKAPFTFDVAAWEVLAPLAYGARVVVPRHGISSDAKSICDLVVKHGVTHLQVVPTLLQELTKESRFSDGETLRHLISSGELLTHELRDSVWDSLPNVLLTNMCGSTEGFYNTFWNCSKDSPVEGAVPVGRAMDGYTLHVLDRSLEECDAGEPGEFHVSGVIARGYASHPRRTADRFVPDPFSTRAGARMYRTGDLLQRAESGEHYFVGRVDRQVKVQGNRIELEAVEATVESHDAIDRAVVLPVRSPDGARYSRLACLYTKLEGHAEPDDDEIRRHVATYLPRYAVPGQIRRVEEFPLTASGKIDRESLAREFVERPMDGNRVPPGTETEKKLAEIWATSLGRAEVGIDDNFFDLGGTSFIAAKIHLRIRETFSDKLEAVDLFEYTTIRTLAQFLDQEDSVERRAADVEAGAKAVAERRKQAARRRRARRKTDRGD